MLNLIKSFTNHKQLYNEAAVNFDKLIEIDDEMRKNIQCVLLEMYDDLANVCQAQNISLFLLGGSALGAVRHKGFIPWDDDLDVGMSRSDYEKFKTVFEEKLGDKYLLNAPNYIDLPKARFPKILKKGTVMCEIGDKKSPDAQGIFLDIFIIENTPDSNIARNVKGIISNMLEYIASQVYFYENKDETSIEFDKKVSPSGYYVRNLTGMLFSFYPAGKWFSIVDKFIQHKNSNSKYCNIATGRKHYFGEILPRKVYFDGTYGTFCGRKVLLPNDVDSYLKNLYGDYMQIPPPEKRERHFIEKIDFGNK